MKPNVFITVRRDGKIIHRHEGHNVWTPLGNEYLASMISYASYGPDTPERVDRLRYMGFGIGGIGQGHPSAGAPPLSTSYPAGADPNATTGSTYDSAYPPIISTLERPIRITGSSASYPGAPGDKWLANPDDGNLVFGHSTPSTVTAIASFDTTLGDFVYAPFIQIPLSELSLVLSSATVPDEPFNTIVAYHTFDTILLSGVEHFDVVWDVNF